MNSPMKSDEQRKKQALRNVGLNLRVEMKLTNNSGHRYGHKEQAWALQQPQTFILGINKGYFNLLINNL